MKDIYAKCGCNCGHCLAYKENSKFEENRERCSKGWEKYLDSRLKPDSIRCEGCQAKDPWKGGNLLPDPACNIRPCAVKTGVKNCAYCSVFPCEDLQMRLPDKDFRKRIENRLGKPIPEQDYRAFIQPYEGVGNLKDIRKCLDPNKIIQKYKVEPLKVQIVPFPDKLKLPKKEVIGFKALHSLISEILSARAKTYSRQIQLMRRRPHILSMFWVLGFYGKLKQENGLQLVVDGSTRDTKKEHSWFVRKRDNAFHGAPLQAARLLKEFGVQIEFVKSNKDWQLKMSFDKKAGGSAALKALNRFITRLGKKHGEPVYAGNTRYKGKAFALFSKVDMRVFG